MLAIIQALVELQKLEMALREVEAARQQGPERISALTETFRTAEAEVGAAKHRFEQLKLEKAQAELDLRTNEDRLAKYQTQLMAVRTNKEYSAALKEIDAVKAEISRLEDDILVKDEEMSSLEKDVPEAEARIAEERQRYEATRADLDAELALVEARLAEFESRRGEIARAIPEDVVAAFNRIVKVRGGVAVVRVKEPVCPACNVRMRIQMYDKIRRGESLIACDSCRRFLYYEEPAEVAIETSPSPPDAGTPAGT